MKVIILTDDELMDLQSMTASPNAEDRAIAGKIMNRLNEPMTHTKKVVELMKALDETFCKEEKALIQAVSNYLDQTADDLKAALVEDVDPEFMEMSLTCFIKNCKDRGIAAK